MAWLVWTVDEAGAKAAVARMQQVPGVTGAVTGPLPAQEGKALQTIVPIQVDEDGWEKIAGVVEDVEAAADTNTAGVVAWASTTTSS